MYWIYILSILPSYQGYNIHYSCPGKKEWQYTALSRDELENTPPRQFAPSAPEIALGQTLGPTTKHCNKITGIVNKRLIVFCIYIVCTYISDLFEVIQNVRHVKDTKRILQFLAQTGAKCAPYCVWAVFGRVALGSHGVEWTCDLQFQFYKRWFSIERNMSQQTLIIVFFLSSLLIFSSTRRWQCFRGRCLVIISEACIAWVWSMLWAIMSNQPQPLIYTGTDWIDTD